MSRIFLVGATGTIGRATVRALQRHGHDVVCFQRSDAAAARRPADRPAERQAESTRGDVTVRLGDVTDPESILRDGLRGEPFDAVVSCLASRTGAPHDAWAIDHRAHQHLLAAAQHGGIPQMVLLSAICVQKPRLAFQHAKLAFERELMASGLTYSIVRPTAYFKSLSGQVERVRNGKPYLMFGDGTLTACKPISDDDLAEFMVGCLTDPSRHNRVLPIGGPGAAITPLQQGEQLFALLGMEPRYRRVPVRMLDVIVGVLTALGRIIPPLAAKAEFARIGRYYATESMLVWDADAGRYDADATPSTGHDTLFDCYAQLVRGEVTAERGDHAVFSG
jgi:divinyl chlorophyllide a 8-vinyl-reductase